MTESVERRTRLPRLAQLAVGLTGTALLALLIGSAGSRAVMEALERLSAVLPMIALIELLRATCEASSTHALLGDQRSKVPLSALVRSTLAGYAVNLVVPGGRPACEAVRASLLAPYVGWPRAAAVGVANQTLNLLGESTLAVLGLLGLWLLAEASPLCFLLLGHAVICALASGLVMLAVRGRITPRVVDRFPRVSAWIERTRAGAGELSLVSVGPLSAFIASKALQTAQLAILLQGAGIPLAAESLPIVQALNSLASAVSDLSPAQLGTVDGVFALGAHYLHADAAAVLAATSALHAVQLGCVAVAAISSFVVPAAIARTSPVRP